MKKSNINLLLVALSSAAVLAACNSGSSPSPSPTPTPTPSPSPTPTPTPTPTPVPPPSPTESGVAVLGVGSGTSFLPLTLSATPSQNNWTNYTSGTQTAITALVAGSDSELAWIGGATNAFTFGSSSDGQFVYAALGSSFGTTANKAIAYGNGTYVIINDAGTLVTTANESGVVVPPSALLNASGQATTLVPVALTYVNSQFVLATSTGLYTSTNGINWTTVTASVGATVAGVTAVNYVNGIYVALVGGQVYLGTTLGSLKGTGVAATAMAVNGTTLSLYAGTTVTNYTPNATASSGTAGLGSALVPTLVAPASTTSLTYVGSTLYANTGAIVAKVGSSATSVATGGTGLVVAAQGGELLVANTGNTLANNASTSATAVVSGTSVTGNLASFESNTWTLLPSGQASFLGFAGSDTGYMAITATGTVLVYSNEEFVPGTTITNNTGASVTLTGGLYYANGQYLTYDATGNIYVSSNNGTTWTYLAAPKGVITGVSVANNMFYITANGGVSTYQTATPLTSATWVNVASIATPGVNAGVYAFGEGTYFFSNSSTAINVWTGSAFVLSSATLPAPYLQVSATTPSNFATSATTAALAQGASNYIWTTSNVTGTWNQTAVSFAQNAEATATPSSFATNPQLLWTGVTWVAQVTSGGANPYVYTSESGGAWSPANKTTSTTVTGATLQLF